MHFIFSYFNIMWNIFLIKFLFMYILDFIYSNNTLKVPWIWVYLHENQLQHCFWNRKYSACFVTLSDIYVCVINVLAIFQNKYLFHMMNLQECPALVWYQTLKTTSNIIKYFSQSSASASSSCDPIHLE